MNHKLISLFPPRRNVPCLAVSKSTFGNADLVYSRIERDLFAYSRLNNLNLFFEVRF